MRTAVFISVGKLDRDVSRPGSQIQEHLRIRFFVVVVLVVVFF